jgi:AraC-like DNA-binding protein
MLGTTRFMRHRSNVTVDPLSDVLQLLRARCTLSGRLVAGGTWARRFANLDAVKFLAAIEGDCWFYVDDMRRPERFRRGDVLITNGTRSLVLASDSALVSKARTTRLVQDRDGTYRVGSGKGFTMISGMVQIDPQRQRLLLGTLPSLIHVRGTDQAAASLGWLLEQIVSEMQAPARPGRSIVVTQLAQLLFVQTLRAYLSRASDGKRGWLSGLRDERLAPVLASMHAEPSRAWRVEDLAHHAGMSRTSFAVHFREVMGTAPLSYLTSWRMHLAERDLRAGASVSEVARAAGYTSDSAFSHAFKRAMGVAPGRYRRGAEQALRMSS